MGSRLRRRSCRRARGQGQALVEFALIAPAMLLLFVGSLEVSLLMFSRSSAESAAGESAQVAARAGNAANADALSVQVVRDSALGHTLLAVVNEVDIYRLDQTAGGTITADPAHRNRYRLDGTPIGPVNWPPVTRNVSSSNDDLLGLTIDYTYPWQTGLFNSLPAPRLQATYYLRLEPQTF